MWRQWSGGTQAGWVRWPGWASMARSSGVYQNYTEIVDVGVSRTTDDQPTGGLEKGRRVVIIEEHLGIEGAARGGSGGQRCRIDGGACGIIGTAFAAVDAVGVGGEGRDAGQAVEDRKST